MPAKTYRLIVLGSAKVGKTSIIRRFFYEEFSDKYKETIEDLHSRNFKIQGTQLSLEILDTNFNFPDMRKLAVASADSFMLVFAVDDIQSFKEVTALVLSEQELLLNVNMSELWTELCERRTDIRQLPIVIVGNKSDLSSKKVTILVKTFFSFYILLYPSLCVMRYERGDVYIFIPPGTCAQANCSRGVVTENACTERRLYQRVYMPINLLPTLAPKSAADMDVLKEHLKNETFPLWKIETQAIITSSLQIYEATATAWTSRLNANVRYVEASAKTAQNVASIFKSLLELSDFSHIKVHAGGLESSTHGSDQDPLDSKCQLSWPSSSSLVTPMPDMELKRNRSLRVKGACEKKLPLERHTNDEEMTSLQRSNSLIRRTKHLSLRVRAHGNRAVEGTSDQENDCKIT
uniref:GTP-binding protein Di-Ras2 n=1 Tax=Ascaris lumbricoides TaxID=6252 RepID=A0A0M3HMU1_ASCLU